MTTPVSNTVNTIAQVVIALCTLAILCLSFWKAPKPVDQKLAILRFLVGLSEIVAVVMTGYFIIFTERITPVTLCAFYYLLVRYAMFVAARDPLTRSAILTLVSAAVFAATAPVYQTLKISIKLHSMTVQNESHIVSILERLPVPPRLTVTFDHSA